MKARNYSTAISKMCVCTLAVLLTMFANGYSQRVHFGLSYGLNVSNWRGEMTNFTNDFEQEMLAEGLGATFQEKPRLGINIGMSLSYKPAKWFVIQPEVNYINEGTHLSGTCNVEGTEVGLRLEFNVHYINIPVALKFCSSSGISVF